MTAEAPLGAARTAPAGPRRVRLLASVRRRFLPLALVAWLVITSFLSAGWYSLLALGVFLAPSVLVAAFQYLRSLLGGRPPAPFLQTVRSSLRWWWRALVGALLTTWLLVSLVLNALVGAVGFLFGGGGGGDGWPRASGGRAPGWPSSGGGKTLEWVECGRCWGGYGSCQRCDGTGHISTDYLLGSKTCPRCRGTKKARCLKCNGTGKRRMWV